MTPDALGDASEPGRSHHGFEQLHGDGEHQHGENGKQEIAAAVDPAPYLEERALFRLTAEIWRLRLDLAVGEMGERHRDDDGADLGVELRAHQPAHKDLKKPRRFAFELVDRHHFPRKCSIVQASRHDLERFQISDGTRFFLDGSWVFLKNRLA